MAVAMWHKMGGIWNLVCIGSMFIALCGCTRTVVDGSGDSPGKSHRLWISSHGALGKAYVDKSKKNLWVSIEGAGTNSAVLLQKRYGLMGSDIEWHIHWSSEEDVSVVFYDWGDGISSFDKVENLSASNHIATLAFALDRGTGKFVETPSQARRTRVGSRTSQAGSDGLVGAD